MLMASVMNTVSKDFIKAKQLFDLPFIDNEIEAVTIAIKNEKEARMVLREVRGY